MKKNIVYVSDLNYINYTLVSINSAYINGNSDAYFYIIVSEFDFEIIVEKIENLKKIINFPIVNVIKINPEIFANSITSKSITAAAYYRLLIPVLFENEDRVLYIDGDTLILNDLKELFSLNYDPEPVNAVLDDNFGKDPHINKFQKYVNSGVLLFNNQKIHSQLYLNDIIKILHEKRDQIKYHDQCLLNIYLNGKVGILPGDYNCMMRLGNLKSDDWLNFDFSQIKIIHFLGAAKPWTYSANVASRAFWQAYSKMTNFGAEIIKIPKDINDYIEFRNIALIEGNLTKVIEIDTYIMNGKF